MIKFRTHKEITWAEGIDPQPRYVVCAANSYGGFIIAGARHHDSVMRDVTRVLGGGDHRTGFKILMEMGEEEQGFIDQYGDFMSREEAAFIVEANNQPMAEKGEAKGHLISENLY